MGFSRARDNVLNAQKSMPIVKLSRNCQAARCNRAPPSYSGIKSALALFAVSQLQEKQRFQAVLKFQHRLKGWHSLLLLLLLEAVAAAAAAAASVRTAAAATAAGAAVTAAVVAGAALLAFEKRLCMSTHAPQVVLQIEVNAAQRC
jgi:hypothetical protein